LQTMRSASQSPDEANARMDFRSRLAGGDDETQPRPRFLAVAPLRPIGRLLPLPRLSFFPVAAAPAAAAPTAPADEKPKYNTSKGIAANAPFVPAVQVKCRSPKCAPAANTLRESSDAGSAWSSNKTVLRLPHDRVPGPRGDQRRNVLERKHKHTGALLRHGRAYYSRHRASGLPGGPAPGPPSAWENPTSWAVPERPVEPFTRTLVPSGGPRATE